MTEYPTSVNNPVCSSQKIRSNSLCSKDIRTFLGAKFIENPSILAQEYS